MPEARPDFAPFMAALRTAFVAYWAGLGDLTLSNGETVARPEVVFGAPYAPGSADAWIEVDWTPGSSISYGGDPASAQIKQTPAVVQVTAYRRTDGSEEIAEILADRIADTMRSISVTGLHSFATDDPVPAPAPPTGFVGSVLRTSALRLCQT